MKIRCLFLIQSYLLAMSVFSQSSSMNYVVKYQPQTELTMQASYTPTQAFTEVNYFDGLGRPIETVQKGITPSGYDLVTMTEYDGKGRMDKEWLPVVVSGNNGNFISADRIPSYANSTYQDSYAYNDYTYEETDLSRVLTKTGPGKIWRDKYRRDRNSYLTNNLIDAKLKVFKYVVSNGLLKKEGFYGKGELSVNQLCDEDVRYSLQFLDKNGRIVLSRKLDDSKMNHDTYYVYDNKGNKCFVLSPMASDRLTEDKTYPINDLFLDQYVYIYTYDSQNRCITKKLPGALPIYYVYDKLDRIILSQDGNQRSKKKWSFTKYDGLLRPILNGVVAILNKTHEQLQNDYANVVSKEELTGTYLSANGGYTNNTQPTSGLIIHLATYYDDYSFLPTASNLAYVSTNKCDPAELNAKGLTTGQYSLLLDGSNKHLACAFYYDKNGYIVQQRSDNILNNGFDITNTHYNFLGNPINTYIHHTGYGTTIPEVYTYTYDHGGRLKNTIHRYNNNSERIISKQNYNELCLLSSNKMGSLSPITYNYNIRSWIKNISSDYYEQTNFYEDTNDAIYHSYSGNISVAKYLYKQKDPILGNVNESIRMGYYRYDKLGRVIAASLIPEYNSEYFVESSTYDKNGNYTNLSREYKGGIEDIIVFNNRGNQLYSAVDEYTISRYQDELIQFGSYSYDLNEQTFYYDVNGNLIKDLNRGIINVTYNALNLPQIISFKNGNQIINSYSASGKKCKVKYRTMENPVIIPAGNQFPASQNSLVSREDSTEYCGNYIYENGELIKILIPGGYVAYNEPQGFMPYNYYIKDHLGTNRAIINEDYYVMQTVEYLASGIPMFKNDLKDNYLHTGKEFESMHGLHWYDNNKRMYDPILCRFTTMDPLCEKYYDTSPYAHCGNNPVNNIDLNGDSIWFSYQRDKDNQLTGVTMHVTGKVLDISNNHVDLNDATNTISNSIQSSFKGNVKGVSFTTDVNLQGAKDMSGVSDSDHLFVLANFVSDKVAGVSSDFFGKVAYIDADYFTGFWDKNIGNTGEATAAHEFGHLLGLEHPQNGEYMSNLMQQGTGNRWGGVSTHISSKQLLQINHNSKYMNQGMNYQYSKGVINGRIIDKKIPYRGFATSFIR